QIVPVTGNVKPPSSKALLVPGISNNPALLVPGINNSKALPVRPLAVGDNPLSSNRPPVGAELPTTQAIGVARLPNNPAAGAHSLPLNPQRGMLAQTRPLPLNPVRLVGVPLPLSNLPLTHGPLRQLSNLPLTHGTRAHRYH